MKNIQTIILSVIIILVFISCKKEKKDEIPTPYPQASAKKAYEKKWNVSSISNLKVAKVTAEPQLQSIEFMLNSYVLIYSNDSVITGDYSQQDQSTILLDGFGVLVINQITSGSFNFTITPTGASSVVVTTIVANLVASGNNTTALCNTWKITKATSSDPGYTGIPSGMEAHLIFSEYGTYLSRSNDNGTISYEHGTWNWNNSDQTSFCVGDNTNSCIEVWASTFLDGNSKLEIINTVQSNFIKYELAIQ